MASFLPFDVLQKKMNERYYKSRGRKLYSDFKTFGSSDKVATANAIEFFHYISENDSGSEIKIYEFGIGNGLFSKYFLEKFHLLDRRREFIPCLSYLLCDISEELVKKAEHDMKKFNVHGIVCDATRSLRFMKNASYVRSNEMYDDLRAKIFVKKENKIFEVYVNKKMKNEYVRSQNEIAKNFMKNMPEGYEIPINFGAERHLASCVKALAPNGYVDIFDYGFASVSEITEMPAEMWNNSIIREFNGQLTTDVNFIYLSQRFPGAAVQPQKSYVENILNRKLFYVELEQLYYLDDEEMGNSKAKMRKSGYPGDFPASGITETDDYKHLRVVR